MTFLNKLKFCAKGEDTYADCYLLKLKLEQNIKEKAELPDSLGDTEINVITLEERADQIEGYNEVIHECKKHFDIHVA